MAPDENDLRSILGVGRGGEGEPSCLEESPLLLFPCPGAEFLEVSECISMCASFVFVAFCEGAPQRRGGGAGGCGLLLYDI